MSDQNKANDPVAAPNSNEVFEVVGDLYYRRFHQLRPGKDAPIGYESPMSDENQQRFGTWLEQQAFDDAITRIANLAVENGRLQNLADELSDLLAEARNEREMYKQQRADWKVAYEGMLERVGT